ncbi:MAG: hypothetical protein EXS16_06130 [Gemmataceae bacterium]|nr:hypothetical protein [Gemmataceae bacterium]
MLPPALRILADLARLRTWNRFHREMVGVAKLAGAGWRDVMLANLSYDLVIASLGCSTIALPTKDGPVLARNMDWSPADLLAQASYLLRYHHNGEPRFVSAGWPGSVGVVTGMSRRGFAFALNAVTGPEKTAKTGYPVLLHLRRVVADAHNFDQALAMLRDQRITSPALFTLVGTENHQRVVIERSPTRHALRYAADGEPLLTTNEYRVMFQENNRTPKVPGTRFYDTTCYRYDALCRFFQRWTPDQVADDAKLLYILSDAQVIQDITAQHVIFRPRTQEAGLWVPRLRMLP